MAAQTNLGKRTAGTGSNGSSGAGAKHIGANAGARGNHPGVRSRANAEKPRHEMSYLRRGYGCMTHTGPGDKCSRCDRGVTEDKTGQTLRDGGEEQERRGVGGWSEWTLADRRVIEVLLHSHLMSDSALPGPFDLGNAISYLSLTAIYLQASLLPVSEVALPLFLVFRTFLGMFCNRLGHYTYLCDNSHRLS